MRLRALVALLVPALATVAAQPPRSAQAAPAPAIVRCTPGAFTGPADHHSDDWLYISPNGRTWDLAIGSDSNAEGVSLARVSPATGSVHRIHTGASTDVGRFGTAWLLGWSPDGTKAVVTNDTYSQPYTPDYKPQPSPLYLVDTVADHSRVLAPTPAFYRSGGWTSDSKQVVVIATPSAQTNAGTVEMIDVSTGAARAFGDAEYADVSPDGKFIAISHLVRQADETSPAQYKLQVIDTATGAVSDISTTASWPPAFAPSGAKLAYSDDPVGLVIVDLSTGDRTIVPNTHGSYILDVTWSPDGRRLAYLRSGEGPRGIPDATSDVVLADSPFNGQQTLIGKAWTSMVAQSGSILAWATGNGLRLTDTRTGQTRAFNPIPARLRRVYAAIPEQVVRNGTRLLYTVVADASMPQPRNTTTGGYRYAATEGSFDRRAAPCTTPTHGGAKVVGTPFNDWINIRNQSFRFARETVTCGAGNDTVIADRVDIVARDCEHINRR